MTIEEKIKVDNNWKELAKEMTDKCIVLNDIQKRILKFCLEMYHERIKRKLVLDKI